MAFAFDMVSKSKCLKGCENMIKPALIGVVILFILIPGHSKAFQQDVSAKANPDTETADEKWAILNKLPPGDELKIELTSGRIMKGRALSWSPDALIITLKGKKTEVISTSIKKVYQHIPKEGGSRAWKGGLIGAGIMGGLSAISVSQMGDDTQYQVLVIGMGTLMGFGIGALVGSSIEKKGNWVVVYEK
jgi:hypothetical protein